MSTTGSSFASIQREPIISSAMSIVFGASSNRSTRRDTGGIDADLSGSGEILIRACRDEAGFSERG
jgi:hypothetical protein